MKCNRLIHTKLKLYKPSSKVDNNELQLNSDYSSFADIICDNSEISYSNSQTNAFKEKDEKFCELLSKIESLNRSNPSKYSEICLNNLDCYRYNNKFKSLLSKENQLILKLKEVGSLTKSDKYYKDFCNEVYFIKHLLSNSNQNLNTYLSIDIYKESDNVTIRINDDKSVKVLSFYFYKDFSLSRFVYINDSTTVKDISNQLYLKSEEFNLLLCKTLAFIKSLLFNSLVMSM